jgi:hypothetical protein
MNKKMIHFLFIICLLCIDGCGGGEYPKNEPMRKHVQNWHSIHPGMNEDEVVKLVGLPVAKTKIENSIVKSEGVSRELLKKTIELFKKEEFEIWNYDINNLVYFDSKFEPVGYVLKFDRMGKLIKKGDSEKKN